MISKIWQVRELRDRLCRIIHQFVFIILAWLQILLACSQGTKTWSKNEANTVLAPAIILVSLWGTKIIFLKIIATKWGLKDWK